MATAYVTKVGPFWRAEATTVFDELQQDYIVESAHSADQDRAIEKLNKKLEKKYDWGVTRVEIDES